MGDDVILHQPDDDSPTTISAGDIGVDVDADRGGRLAQITVGDTTLLVGYGDVPEHLSDDDGTPAATSWGSYPMVPWAGRIRRGRFVFDGVEHRLAVNFGDHAIHGYGLRSSWTVEERSGRHVVLSTALPCDEHWPFAGLARQRIAVDTNGVSLSMEVSADHRPFPVSFGWHPWFRKPERIVFQPVSMYRRDADGITVADTVAVPPGPWDDCFVNIEPVELTIGPVHVRLTSDCTDWVVYDRPDHATCVEPQTGPPDAFTIAPRTVMPGQTHRAWFRIDVLDD